MNVIRMDSAARASSWEGADDGVTLPMLGLVFADSSAIDRGLALIFLVRAGSEACSGVSSGGDSRDEAGINCEIYFEIAESGDVSEPISRTFCRRRRELVAAKEAGKAGLGPQLEIGEKKGEVGLLYRLQRKTCQRSCLTTLYFVNVRVHRPSHPCSYQGCGSSHRPWVS